jgi:hypothetical protein
MSKAEKIIENLKSKIDKIADFVQVDKRKVFEIIEYEVDKQSYIIKNRKTADLCEVFSADGLEIFYHENKVFKISNSVTMRFIPIDGNNGLFTKIDTERVRGGKSKRCDCVFFDEKDFCFLELKSDAISTKKRAVKSNRKEAILQLGNTIRRFDELLENNYQGLNLEAFIATPPTYPRNDTAWKVLARKFVAEYDVMIFETNEKICL